MLQFLQFMAVMTSAVFTGAAIYINVVEHPARMSCTTKTAATVWAPSYKRAFFMQASLALLSFIFGIACWLISSITMWLVAAIFIGAVIPFTLIIIMPVKNYLQAIEILTLPKLVSS